MKFEFKRDKPLGFFAPLILPFGKEIVPPSDRSKPVFSACQLKITPTRTAEDIRRAIKEGRFAEMTPGQAG